MFTLKNSIKIDGLSSIVTGIMVVIFSKFLTNEFGIDNYNLMIMLGNIIIFYGLYLVYSIQDESKLISTGWFSSTINILWVDASILLLLFRPVELSNFAIALTISISVIVVDFIFLQLNAISKIPLIFERSRIIKGDLANSWNIISDLGSYNKYATDLFETTVISGEGIYSVRRCVDKKGSWTETAIKWDENKEYSMKVDTTEYPYPFNEFRGTWRVEKIDNKIKISLKFTYIAKYWIIGRLIMIIKFDKMVEPSVDKILYNYEQEISKSVVPVLNN